MCIYNSMYCIPIYKTKCAKGLFYFYNKYENYRALLDITDGCDTLVCNTLPREKGGGGPNAANAYFGISFDLTSNNV